MRVFVTGATGFVGSFVVAELVAAGHEVVGLTRSADGADALVRAGARAHRGDVNDLADLRAVAATADGVIHTAFDHDPGQLALHAERDRSVIRTLGDALAGGDRPLVITSGTGLVRSPTGGPVLETDPYASAEQFPRGASEEAADELMAHGGQVVVVRLPQVHDTRRQGRIHWHIQIAREQGRVAYVDTGANRVPAAHVTDVARLFRLALENGTAGARYHAVAEQGVALRDIAEVIGDVLDLPVASLGVDEAADYFGWLTTLAVLDLPASGAWTQRQLGWHPSGPDLLTDLAEYSAS